MFAYLGLKDVAAVGQACHKSVDGPVDNFIRWCGLQRSAAMQDAHAVTQHRGFIKVVGDEDNGHV